jgi:hypothetical protein
LTDFVVTKLAESMQSNLAFSILNGCETYLRLFEFLMDFDFILNELTYETLTEDLLDYGIQLCKQGTIEESIGNH